MMLVSTSSINEAIFAATETAVFALKDLSVILAIVSIIGRQQIIAAMRRYILFTTEILSARPINPALSMPTIVLKNFPSFPRSSK